jgi:pimeloyl-ACP methyl ester carboxylesterase
MNTDSDDLDIRAGGAIAVDTVTLRETAARFQRAAADCDHLVQCLREAGRASMRAGALQPAPTSRAEEAGDTARRLARALRDRADVYELIEAEATRRSAEVGSGLAVAALSARLLTQARPDLAAEAARVSAQWRQSRNREVERQLIGAVAPVVTAAGILAVLATAIRHLDRGALVPSDPPLTGAPSPVTVRELSRSSVTSPTSLEQLAARMPGDGDSRVRVEVYTSASGRREYVVYVAGTQSAGLGTSDPWDMGSNLELYTGHRSASYDAVLRAMEEAGAAPGDRVHIVGHSQGGMIATHLAREAGFDVATLVTFATPVQAQLGVSTLNVTVRHTDDPVVALAVGGPPVGGGSRHSFVVDRLADPVPRPADLAFGVHQMDAYRETAALIDASDDPRVDVLRRTLQALGDDDVKATAVVYGARRGTSPAAAPSASSAAGAG